MGSPYGLVSAEGETTDSVRGVPGVNVLTGRWTLLTRPQDGTYRHTVTGDFGEKIEIPVDDQTLVLDSSEFVRVVRA